MPVAAVMPAAPVVRWFNTYEPVTEIYRDVVPALADAGIRSQIVLSSAEYRAGRGRIEEALGPVGAGVTRIPAGTARASTRLRKVAATLTYVAGAAALSLLGPAPRMNFFLTQPPLFAVWGRLLRALRGTPYCCLVMDLYPHVLAAHGSMDEQSLLYRLLRRAVIGALARAQRVFVIGRCMRDRLVGEGVPAHRIAVVENWGNEAAIRPVPRPENRLAASLGITDQFVVLYSGNMGIAHDFQPLLDAAERLRDRADLRFVIFGEGARFAQVEAEIARRGMRNVILGKLQPVERLAESQSLGDVHFVTLNPKFSGLVVPSKAYSTLSAGRALLYEGTASDEIARMVTEEGVGKVVAPGDADGIARAVLAMLDDRAATAAMGDRALALAAGRFGRRAAIERYVSEFRRLTGSAE